MLNAVELIEVSEIVREYEQKYFPYRAILIDIPDTGLAVYSARPSMKI